MEESKKFSVHSGSYTSQAQPLQTSIGGGTVENHVPSHAIRMFPSDKSSHVAISSSVTLASTSIATSTTLQHQSTGNETRAPMVSGGMTGSHLGRNSSSLSLPKVEQAQFKVDGASNASYVLQVQGNNILSSHTSSRSGGIKLLIDECLIHAFLTVSYIEQHK